MFSLQIKFTLSKQRRYIWGSSLSSDKPFMVLLFYESILLFIFDDENIIMYFFFNEMYLWEM